MTYSFEKINTVTACDTLLAGAQRKKQTLARKRRNLGEAIDTHCGRMDQINLESAEVQASLDIFTTAYAALPEGKDKADLKIKLRRLELRQAVLEKKAYTYTVAALLAKEIKYNGLDRQLSALEEYIAAVEEKRAMLGRASPRVTHAVTQGLPVAAESVEPEMARHQGDSAVLWIVARIRKLEGALSGNPVVAVQTWRAAG